jgi:hypothetical protein
VKTKLNLLRGNNLINLFLLCITSSSIFGYKVIIDPGHGGRYIRPLSVYGDKYDPELGKYLDGFRPGAYNNGLFEHEEAYSIAEKVVRFLSLTKSNKGRKEFHTLLKKYYPNIPPPKEQIEVLISRESGHREDYLQTADDPSAPYRLYDYPDIHTGELNKGTISRINSEHPHLVVSIHMTSGGTGPYGALSSVITPSFGTYSWALEYVKGNDDVKNQVQEKFQNSNYKNWFESGHDRSFFEWFICDSWIYFTGFWSKPNGLEAETSTFRGLRQNYINWAYQEKPPFNKNPYTQYSSDLKNFTPIGKFWERELSLPETWRREGGYEKMGGDNYYASNEILRHIRKGLFVNHVLKKNELPEIKEPYISTWAVPTYINAISAYLEVAYLNNENDWQRIRKYKTIQAEAIAVGIYVLFYGSKETKSTNKDLTKGLPIDFNKYATFYERSYFDMVTDTAN